MNTNAVKHILSAGNVRFLMNEPLSSHCTFKIGGRASVVAFPKNAEALIRTVSLCRETETKYTVCGSASNVLFDSSPYDGTVIFTSGIKYLYADGNEISAGCGASLRALSSFSRNNSLSGLEFADGIPGTVGGAVYMNAGAFGHTAGDILISADYYDPDTAEILTLTKIQYSPGNKTDFFTGKNKIILGARFSASAAEIQSIDNTVREYRERREKTQPLSCPSAGSYFKRPEGYYAGKLIEDCGLRGTRVGGASVSEKHAGFIVNDGYINGNGATSTDVLTLEEIIKKTVYEKYGVTLEREVIYIK